MHEFILMLHDPSHWAFEFTVGTLKDLLLFGLGGLVGKRWIRRHDREAHGHD